MNILLPVAAFLGLVSATLGLDCSKRPPGVYEIGCKSYARCDSHGKVVIRDCEGIKVFNTQTLSCDDPAKVPKPCGMIEDCSLRTDGKYSDLSLGCHSFFTCSGGVYFGHNFCPSHLVFNEVLQACDWPVDVYPPCGTKPTTTTTMTP